ncbi:hypothetical protein B0H19DRAFT_1250947 [Mycena capillaripes]|nr:hypothetical protein B0H19DRAFT_1250947 [Mycena capillaripes]
MLAVRNASYIRNPRILLAAFLLTCVVYYSSGSVSSRSKTPDNTVINSPWPEQTVPEQVTVTVHAPRATVTVTTEVFVPKEVVPEEPVVLNGPPTQAFQDNLRPEVQYITTWPGSGFTNDVMTFMNLIYLSLLTQRVPVLPFFTPTHVAKGASVRVDTIDFGEVFDVPRLQKDLGKPILEWWQVKDRNSTSIDPLGCWNIWQAVATSNTGPHFTTGPERLKLDISYTIAPNWIKLYHNDADEPHMTFNSLMTLSFPETRNKHLSTPAESPILKVSLPPDEHLVCFDNMYWIANVEAHEFWHDHSTSWRLVGQYLRWNPRIEDLAQQYVRRTFGLAPTDVIPPYITIHVRHGDFKEWCRRPVAECFAPLSAIARRVDEVKAELLEKKGLRVDRVIMTSDEKDSNWWDEVAPYGWVRIDHRATAEAHGGWYPLLIDAAIQSGGMGLVGTDLSTVSMIAGNRVRTWHDGAVRMVKWGKPGADDH